jgi:MULE transposase domain
MTWQAKSGCAEHHRTAVERIANSFPVPWLLAPRTGEVFDNLEHCNRRLRAWAFVEGFDIVRNGGGTAANPSYRFRCIFHGIVTKNNRKLEDRVERDEEGRIASKRQREATSARQLQCPWSALCSFKDIGKRGTGDKGFVLTVQCEDHQNHQLAEDPFQFPAHLKSSEEYLEAHRQAIKHREQILPYSVSRRLIDAEDLGVVLSSRDYYNSVRKQLPDKAKPETIVALLRMLEDNKFVYTTRFKVEKDLTGKPISRKLVQLFFAHPKQLEAATRFVSDWVIIIDGTFNTNELRLPLLVVVGVLSTNKTFPVAFSYCPSESAVSIGFVWSSLKEECFIPASAALPRVVIGDWAAGLTSSVPKAFPEARFQGCDWHAVGAMLKFYRGKTQNYTSEEIDGSGEKLLKTQSKADLRVPGLHYFSWVYIKSASLEELETNRSYLISLLRPKDKHYINEHWRKLEEQVIHYYTRTYANLGSTASQRGESYHPVVRKITNGQLCFEDSGKRLAATVLSILKDLATHEYSSMRSYDRCVQLDYAAFQNLLCTISNFALRKIEAEWVKMIGENKERYGRASCSRLYSIY